MYVCMYVRSHVQALIGPNFAESVNLSSLTQQIWMSVDGDEIDITGALISVFGIFKFATEVHVYGGLIVV